MASRDELTEENRLLDDLEKRANTSPAGPGWAQYFSKWRGLNVDLIKLSDPAFNQELDNEIARLEKMRGSLAGDSSHGAKFWVDMLNLDIANANTLKI